MRNWFYSGFTKRKNLTWVRNAGASRKLPNNWEAECIKITNSISQIQQCHRNENGTLVPEVTDDNLCYSDHIPMYIDMPGNYSWGEMGSSGAQIATSGKEKSRFTLQMQFCKSGRQIRPVLIFKGAAPRTDGRRQGINTIAFENEHRLPDIEGNPYTPAEKASLR